MFDFWVWENPCGFEYGLIPLNALYIKDAFTIQSHPFCCQGEFLGKLRSKKC